MVWKKDFEKEHEYDKNGSLVQRVYFGQQVDQKVNG